MNGKNLVQAPEESVTVQVTIHRQVNTIAVGPDLAYFQEVYRFENMQDHAPDNFRARYKTSVRTGFAKPADILAFLDDSATEIKAIPGIRVVPPEFRDLAQRSMFMEAFEVAQDAIVAKSDYFDELKAGLIDLDNVVRLDLSNHMLFDRHGEVLPVGITFDYVSGVHSRRYNLDIALEVLLKDPRVTPRPARRGAPAKSLCITRADEFSSDANNDKHISFMFSPTAEDMRAIWAKCQTYGEKLPSTLMRQAMFDLDMLGLRAAGAAKYSDYWGIDEPSDDENT